MKWLRFSLAGVLALFFLSGCAMLETKDEMGPEQIQTAANSGYLSALESFVDPTEAQKEAAMEAAFSSAQAAAAAGAIPSEAFSVALSSAHASFAAAGVEQHDAEAEAMALESEPPPDEGRIVLPEAGGFSGPFELVKVQRGEGVFKMPYYISRGNPDNFTSFFGIHWTDSKSWIPIIPTGDNYSNGVTRQQTADGSLEVIVRLPEKKNPWIWFRGWTYNNLLDEPGWINQADKHMRKSEPISPDVEGYPAYEGLLNTETGEMRTVPKSYDMQK